MLTVNIALTFPTMQELLVHRTWDAAAHPDWLVFEVEGQIQIRPKQYEVVQHLLERPGAICQLNMGEGKTRVILPMLALQLAKGHAVVRCVDDGLTTASWNFGGRVALAHLFGYIH